MRKESFQRKIVLFRLKPEASYEFIDRPASHFDKLKL